jgi:hypothetical protein
MRLRLMKSKERWTRSNGHMNNCMKMMGKRQNMGGMSGKMRGAMMSGRQNQRPRAELDSESSAGGSKAIL